MTRSSTVQAAIDRYCGRLPGALEAQHNDPQYAHHMAWLSRMLEIADMAMEDEQIPEQSRARVIRTILYGSPDETDALARIEQQAAKADAIARNAPAAYDIPDELAGGVRTGFNRSRRWWA